MMKALCFDLFGTLCDTGNMRQYLAEVTTKPVEFAALWRAKQLEYSFLLSLMGAYQPFSVVTRLALEYTIAHYSGLPEIAGETTAERTETLMRAYYQLAAFPEASHALNRLQSAGIEMAVLSNGDPQLQEVVLRNAGLASFFSTLISADEVKVFKPDPRVYRHAAERLGYALADLWLVAANPFDVNGAKAAGMGAAWINRSGAVFDPLTTGPDVTFSSLEDLADHVLQL
ncbi:MAG: haloacid dehalogenase type II [Chloroflexi bacterium]|nr:haloacid dehalogenase type II [Chloroflexota bacterium]